MAFPKMTTVCNSSSYMSKETALCYAIKPIVQPVRLDALSNKLDLKRPVYDIVLFGYEADTLEIRLVESHRLVRKTILIEAAYDHHGAPKPCIWKKYLATTPRFNQFNVRSICVSKRPPLAIRGAQPIDWKYEWYQQSAAERVVKRLASDAIVVFGHVDEIPLRSVWHQLATSDTLGNFPTNVAIRNLHGHIGYAVPSVYQAKGHPYTLGSPLVTRSSLFKAVHPHGSFSPVWLIGGVHLTNYCYAGNRILKEWTATEARPDEMTRIKPTCASQVAGCRRSAFGHNTRTVSSNELPIMLRDNQSRYPEWTHQADSRLASSCDLHITSEVSLDQRREL